MKGKVLFVTFVVLAVVMTNFARAETWSRAADIPSARCVHSVATVKGKIYAIGGCSPQLKKVEEYDPSTDTWTRKADMPTGRAYLSCSVVNDKIYAIGGSLGGNNGFSSVEEYDPATDAWTKKESMPTARLGLATGMVNGKIYAIGGGGDTKTVEEYDPATDTWTRKADMPTGRGYLSCSVVNEKIYVIGGWSSDNVTYPTVEEYDPATDTWTKKVDMPTARWALATSVVNEKIYASGGMLNYPPLPISSFRTLEEYDPVTDTWKTKSPLPVTRAGHVACTVNGKMYVIAGSPLNYCDSQVEVYVYDPDGEPDEVDDIIPPVGVGFELVQNYPNPFNPSTIIQYSLPEEEIVVEKGTGLNK